VELGDRHHPPIVAPVSTQRWRSGPFRLRFRTSVLRPGLSAIHSVPAPTDVSCRARRNARRGRRAPSCLHDPSLSIARLVPFGHGAHGKFGLWVARLGRYTSARCPAVTIGSRPRKGRPWSGRPFATPRRTSPHHLRAPPMSPWPWPMHALRLPLRAPRAPSHAPTHHRLGVVPVAGDDPGHRGQPGHGSASAGRPFDECPGRGGRGAWRSRSDPHERPDPDAHPEADSTAHALAHAARREGPRR
jgi:hypothetical protein